MSRRLESTSHIPPFSPELHVFGLATLFGVWILVGASAYRSHYLEGEELVFSEVMILMLGFIAHFLLLGLLYSQYDSHPYRCADKIMVMVAGIISLCASLAFCLVTAEDRTTMQHTLIITSCLYAGITLEATTGTLTTRYRRFEGPIHALEARESQASRSGDQVQAKTTDE